MLALILRAFAALACFIMAMMAARDAQVARARPAPIAFGVFALLAIAFMASCIWLVVSQ